MKIKYLLTILIILLFFKISGQTKNNQGIALNLGYSYINTNAGYLGGEYSYSFNPDKWQRISIGTGIFLGNFNRKFKLIPEAHFIVSGAFILGELSMTPYNINPKIGVKLINLARINIGYSWKIGNEDINIKGITFGFNILLGSSGFYDWLH